MNTYSCLYGYDGSISVITDVFLSSDVSFSSSSSI